MLKKLSIRTKLVAIIAAVSIVTLASALTLFVWWDLNAFHQDLIDEKRSQAEIVATNSGAPILFGDEEAASEILGSLKFHSEIESAGLFTKDGKLLTSFTKPNSNVNQLQSLSTATGFKITGETLITKAAVRHQREHVGDLVIVSSLRQWKERRDAFMVFTMSLSAMSLVASVLFGLNLQRFISGPILKLASAMRTVSQTRDYSLRVENNSSDEVGQLVSGFNTMLAEIQTRDAALLQAKEELEDRVRLRTAELRQEVSERQAREAEVRSSQKQLSDFFDTAPIGIVRLDDRGCILAANQTHLDIYGYSMHEFIGRNLDEFHVDTDGLQELIRKLTLGETVHNFESTIRTKDSAKRVVQINATPYWQNGRFVYAGLFVRDITLILKAEEVERAKERAERANHAKNEFLSRMSHELRTPLNSILGFGQLLELEPLDPRSQECVEQILKGGKHLLNLINEVLNISRIEAGYVSVSLEPICIGSVLREAIDLVSPLAAPKTITIHNEVSESEDTYVQADRQRLSQVLLNLLTNAVKYNETNGEVRCSASVLQNGRVQIAISNTGPGIDPEMVDRLFVPFDRMGAEQTEIEGTGLGLPLSKSLTDVMGGTLCLDLEFEGPGTRFLIELPASEAMPRSPELELTEFEFPTARLTRPQTVLLIEDNMSSVKLIEQVLGSRPSIRLLVAMQGSLGLEFAREHCPDLILLDNNLPDIPGSEVAEQILANPRLAHVPIVLMSADATLREHGKLEQIGIFEYLPKPLDVRKFVAVLDRLLEREERLSA